MLHIKELKLNTNQNTMLSLGKKNFRIKLGKENQLLSNGSYKCSPSKKQVDDSVQKLSAILQNFGNMFLSKMEALEKKVSEMKIDEGTNFTRHVQAQNTDNTSPKPANQKKNGLQIEERFKCIEIEMKKLGQENREEDIEEWLGITCKNIFSVSFKMLLNGTLNIESTKVYCSENLLYWIIKFIKFNDLSKDQVNYINTFLKEQLLPYFGLKYPQSEVAKANLRLSKQVIKIDNYNSNNNQLVHLSETNFQLDSKGEYNKEIMSVLNYIISLPNGMTNLETKKQVKKVNSEGEVQKLVYQKNKQKTTLYNAFQYEMEQLFKSIQVQHQMLRMKAGEAPDQSKVPPYNATKAQMYKEKVKEYTKYLIGRKIPENMMEYTEQEIAQQKLTIKNSQILRILNKLCESLEEKFYQMDRVIINREEQFRMKDASQGYLKKTHRILLAKLLEREKGNIEEYLERVMQNNYSFQYYFANEELPRRLRSLTEQEAIVGLFSAANFRNNQNYIIGYLNRLIHGILTATDQFEKMMKIETLNTKKSNQFKKAVENFCDNKITLEKLEEIQSRVPLKKLKGKNVSESVPQLVTFRLGDIMRCKFSSKESEVTAIYKQVLRISKTRPEIMEVIRIKNRLEKGNKDIMINLLYHKSIVVEMQLKVDQAKHNFITCSNNFNHYLYELRRAQFGPISEICSIWMNKDHRAKFYEQKFNKLNSRKKVQKFVHDCPGALSEESLPIKCSYCSVIFNKTKCIQKNYTCKVCDKNICGFCSLQMNNDLVRTSLRTNLKGIIADEEKLVFMEDKIPQSGACIDLKKKDIFVKKFFKVQYNGEICLFDEQSQGKYNLLYTIKNEKERKNFLNSHAIVQIPKFNSRPLMEIALDYFTPKQFELIFKEQRNVVLEEKMQISDKQLQNITPCPYVKKINISQNNITKIDVIVQKFPSLMIAVISQNKIASISPTIHKLPMLQFLDLSWNKIKMVPPEILKLKYLTSLNLSHNNIDTMPQNLTVLQKLKNLTISNNNLKTIPDLPVSLRKIDFNHNRLTNSINISKFKNIKNINISFNKLESIEGATDLPELRFFDVSYNDLKQLHLNNMVQLVAINASYCQLTEFVFTFDDPSENWLENLNLAFNKFTELPQIFFKQICKVENLNLACNLIEKLPKGIGHLKNLQDLNIMGIRQDIHKNNQLNEMKGDVQQDKKPRKKSKFFQQVEIKKQVEMLIKPEREQEFTQKSETDFYESDISQSDFDEQNEIIPEELQNLFKINSLIISRNGLTKIPKTLSKMPHLQDLDISDNKISKINQFLGVITLDISNNKLRDFSQNTASLLPTLRQINLKGNKLKSLQTQDIKKLFVNNVEVEFKQTKQSQKSIKTNSSKGKKKDKNHGIKDSKSHIIHFKHIQRKEGPRESKKMSECQKIQEVMEENESLTKIQ